MAGYKELAQLGGFSLSDVDKLTNNRKTAYSLLYRLMKKGQVKKIRNGLYTCVNLATGESLASRYQIACAINETAYLSHHSAFEHHGLANQIYYQIYVSSEKRFSNFSYEGFDYKYVASRLRDGVIEPKNSQGVRVTDLERTVVDSIKDLDKIAGLEEFLNCLSSIPYLDADRLIKYLEAYNIQALHQRTGFFLQHYMHELQLPESFINYCKSKVGQSTRYLTAEAKLNGTYNKEWRLVVPPVFFTLTEQGGGGLV